MDVRFQSMTVKAFRSIGESLTFDLHSPLTLVYAPNGTGKTTLCEAAEWLLTGEVERLSSTAGFEASTLTSKFLSPPKPTEVSANFLSADGIKYFSRMVRGRADEIKIGESASSSTKISSKDWLGLISSNLEVGRPGLTASEKTIKRWMRGSRFLTIDDLTSLMDGDDVNLEKRMQVFSDLLGIRHLFDASKSLNIYLDDINQELNVLRDDFKGLVGERESLKGLEKNLIENPVIYWAGFDGQLDIIEEKVNEGGGKGSTWLPARDRIETLGSILLGQDQDNRNKLAIADQINGLVSARARDVSIVRDLSVKCTDLKNNITLTQEYIAQRSLIVASVQSQFTMNDKNLNVFPGVRTVVEAKVKDFLTAFEFHSDTLKISRTNNLRKLRRLLSKRSITAGLDNDSSHIRVLNIVERDIPEIRDKIKKLSGFRKKIAIELAGDDNDVQLETSLREAEQELAKNLKDLHAIEQPLLKLQVGVKEYLSSEHVRGTSDCPVCGCEHGTSEGLLSAMKNAMVSLPKLIESKQGECQLTAAKIDYWKRQIDSRKELKSRVVEIDRELAMANDCEKDLIARLGLHGISSRDPKSSIEKEIAREDLAVKLSDLLSSISAIEQAFPGLEQISLCTVEELFITKALHDYQHLLESNASKLRESIIRETHHLNGLRSKVEIDTLSLRDLEIKLGFSQRKLNDVSALWKSLTTEELWSQDRFTKVHRQLLDKEQELKLLRKKLDELGRKLASSHAMVRRDEIDKNISELSEKLSVAEARQKLMVQAKDDFDLEYDNVTKKRIGHLSDSVTPLFLRMHSNRIYDSISFKEGDRSGLLNATTAEDVFNPYTDFSQGQRQDLALAIFLARARAVGGTFFLDEPVMHLDDLNRVALLDILRAFTLENSDKLNLVVTTSSKALTRHMIQKFSSIDKFSTPLGMVSPLTVYGLEGNALTGVVAKKIYGG